MHFCSSEHCAFFDTPENLQLTEEAQPAQSLDSSLLERYAKTDSFSLELSKVVLSHELMGHMEFNDDITYKSLMNEVQAVPFWSVLRFLTSFAPFRFWLASRGCFSNWMPSSPSGVAFVHK